MPGLSPDLSRRLRETLSRCGPFDSDRALRAVFEDARIAPWCDLIFDNTPNRAARIDALIEALLEQVNDASDSALALFLDVLADRISPCHACKQQLAHLAAELRELPSSPTEAEPALSGVMLQERYFVTCSRDKQGYSLHPLDREYAYQQLVERSPAGYSCKALQSRAADYYASTAKQKNEWEFIEDLQPKLMEFEHRIQAEEYATASQVLHDIGDSLFEQAHYGLLARLNEQLRGFFTKISPGSQLHCFSDLGRAYYSIGEPKDALDLHEEALRLAQNLGDRKQEGIEKGHLGNVHRALGEIQKTVGFYQEALDIAREVGDSHSECLQLGNMGTAYRDQGEIDEAIKMYEQALDIARKIGDRHIKGIRLGNLGVAYRMLGRLKEATDRQEEARAIAVKVGDRRGEGMRLGSLGNIFSDQGRFEQAISYYETSVQITHEIGDLWAEGARLGGWGDAYFALGEIQQAIEYYQRALEIEISIKNRRQESIQRGRLGKAYYLLGDLKPSEDYYQDSLKIADEIRDFRGQGYCHLGLSRICLVNQDLTGALQHCEEAIKLPLPKIVYQAVLIRSMVLLYQHSREVSESFEVAADKSRGLLQQTPGLYQPQYALATAFVGQAICNSRWADSDARSELLKNAMDEYRRAFNITAAKGVIEFARLDLELICNAGIEGLEPVFELLRNAKYIPDTTEDSDKLPAPLFTPEV